MPSVTNITPVTFTLEDLVGIDLPHNEPLVIELHIDVNEVTRIQIDTGSLVNVIFRDVLKKMELHEKDIKPSIRPLTGFEENTMMISRIIKMPIYIGFTTT